MRRSRKSALSAGALIVALVATVAVSSVVFASGSDPTQPAPQVQAAGLKGRLPGAVLAYIAGKAGVDFNALVQEFKSGKTLQEIAQEHGIDWSTITAMFAPDAANKQQRKEKAVNSLDKKVTALQNAKSKLEERIAKGQEAVDKLNAKIPTMRNETLKGFAQRQLDILQQKLALGKQRLELLEKELSLAQDELAYFQSL